VLVTVVQPHHLRDNHKGREREERGGGDVSSSDYASDEEQGQPHSEHVRKSEPGKFTAKAKRKSVSGPLKCKEAKSITL
jgi:hypothetical protein